MDELLKQISQNPDSIDSFSSEQVAAHREAINDFVAKVRAGEVEADAEALTEAKALSERLTARQAEIDEDQAKLEATLAELEQSLGIVEDGPEDEDEDEGAESEEEAVVELEPVVASVPVGRLAEVMPVDVKPVEPSGPALIASAGPQEGKSLTAAAFSELIIDKYRSITNPNPVKLATIETKHKYSLRKSDDEYNARVLAEVARDAAANGNLVASGGICAPPQVLYSFFNIATRAGILNFPTVNAPRGSVTIPVSPSLGDFLGANGIAREWTADNDANPTSPATKPVFVIDCPTPQTCEVSAWPTILQIGNFMGRFYPEAVENATALAAVAADRALNAARIAFLASVDVAGNTVDTGGGALVNLAHNLASNAADYRATYGMARDAVLEVVLPSWLPDAAYADAITRDSTNGSSLNGWLGALFAELNLRPQFVYDLDPQTNGLFELEANAYMYAPGTVVELDGGTLDLGVVRDSDLNSTNDYQIFTEPFIGFCEPGHEVRSLTIVVCANGGTGDRQTITCPAVS